MIVDTYVAVLKEFMHVDSFSVQNGLLLTALRRDFTQQAARKASRLHDNRALGQGGQDAGQVEVHLCHWQRQPHLRLKMDVVKNCRIEEFIGSIELGTFDGPVCKKAAGEAMQVRSKCIVSYGQCYVI